MGECNIEHKQVVCYLMQGFRVVEAGEKQKLAKLKN